MSSTYQHTLAIAFAGMEGACSADGNWWLLQPLQSKRTLHKSQLLNADN